MKKYIVPLIIGLSIWKLIIILIIALTINNIIVVFNPEYQLDLPRCEKREFYSSGDFQDYTDFAKYYYNISMDKLEESSFLKEVTDDDCEEIKGYRMNFEEWIELSDSEELNENYDFDSVIIECGDYFYIKNDKRNDKEWGYASYDVYYFDVETQIMYYMHNNI